MPALWNDDEQLFLLARQHLFTALVGDVMDKIGLTRQFLPPRIKPLRCDMVVIGRAMTVLEADVFPGVSEESTNQSLSQPFGLMLDALDDLKPLEVYVCTGASPQYALWGELMSIRARYLGAVGAVVDGFSRDTAAVLELNFPTFSYGGYAQDQSSRGKVIDFRVPLEIGNVRVRCGDIIFGDRDGVCVVPKDVEEDILTKALDKAKAEKTVKGCLQKGMPAKTAFSKYGIF